MTVAELREVLEGADPLDSVLIHYFPTIIAEGEDELWLLATSAKVRKVETPDYGSWRNKRVVLIEAEEAD